MLHNKEILIESITKNGNKVLIWGACERNDDILGFLRENGINVVGYIDRDYDKNKNFENYNNYYSMENYYDTMPRNMPRKARQRKAVNSITNIFYDEEKIKKEVEKPKQKVSYVRLRPLEKNKYK